MEFHELEDIYNAVRIANTNLASVAVIPQSIAMQENVLYLRDILSEAKNLNLI